MKNLYKYYRVIFPILITANIYVGFTNPFGFINFIGAGFAIGIWLTLESDKIEFRKRLTEREKDMETRFMGKDITLV